MVTRLREILGEERDELLKAPQRVSNFFLNLIRNNSSGLNNIPSVVEKFVLEVVLVLSRFCQYPK